MKKMDAPLGYLPCHRHPDGKQRVRNNKSHLRETLVCAERILGRRKTDGKLYERRCDIVLQPSRTPRKL